MVHFFKLLLATGVTYLSLVPLMPSRSSAGEIVLAQNLSVHSAISVTTLFHAVQTQWVEPAMTEPAMTEPVILQAPRTAEPQPLSDSLASAEKLLIPRANSIDLEQIVRWAILALIPVGVVGTALYYLRRTARQKSMGDVTNYHSPTAPPQLPQPQLPNEAIPAAEVTSQKGYNHALRPDDSLPKQATETQATETTVTIRSHLEAIEAHLPHDATVTQTTRISKVDIVEALMNDLHHSEASQRRKSIWELGQRGDSRAIQPLVDLLVDADSQQRSLILAAIAEISSRTLKPMHRALLMSLQDESADVRKNAIRDITRIYDQMAQVSQLLQYAASDADADVQETARWALGQLNRLRSAPEPEQLKPAKPDELPPTL